MGANLTLSDSTGTPIIGGTDGTIIGNVGDQLKMNATVTVSPATSTFGNVLVNNEITVATKTETDLTSVTHTVAGGKKFVLTSFAASFDGNGPIYMRLKKQTGGSGAFNLLLRISLQTHGQDASNYSINFEDGLYIGDPGDVFKVTYESSLAKGSLWAGFAGIEY